MVLIDYNAIYNIVKNINFNTISINRTNRRLTNVSVYLFIYLLDIYYIPSCFNLVLNAFSHLQTIEDDTIRTDNEVEPTFDTIQDEDNKEKFDNVPNNIHLVYKMRSTTRVNNFFLTEVVIQIDDILQQQFILIYKKDSIYNKIIQDLRPNSTKTNEKILKTSKFGYLFHFTDRLFYSKDNKYYKRLIIFFPFVQKFL